MSDAVNARKPERRRTRLDSEYLCVFKSLVTFMGSDLNQNCLMLPKTFFLFLRGRNEKPVRVGNSEWSLSSRGRKNGWLANFSKWLQQRRRDTKDEIKPFLGITPPRDWDWSAEIRFRIALANSQIPHAPTFPVSANINSSVIPPSLILRWRKEQKSNLSRTINVC